MTIQLFGIAKEMIGDYKLTIGNSDNITTVGSLKQFLVQKYPSLQTLQSWAIAVDGECVNDSVDIKNDSEIALLPPVSGG